MEKATLRRHEDLTGESDADVVLTAEDLTHSLTDDVGGCVFCGGSIYHEVDNGIGMERVAVVCCDEGSMYYGREPDQCDPMLRDLASKLETNVCLRVEAAMMIDTLIKRMRDWMPEEELLKMDQAVEEGRA